MVVLVLFQENMNPLTDGLGILWMPFRKNITIDSVYIILTVGVTLRHACVLLVE